VADIVAVALAAPAQRRAGLGAAFWAGLTWLAVVLGASLLAPLLPLADPLATDLYQLSDPPSAQHWLGTDTLGRDTLSRMVYGAQVTLLVGIAAVLVGLVLGTTIGLLTGYFRGLVDIVGSWAVNVLLAFPPLILAMALAAFLGASLVNVIIAVGLISIPAFARLAHAATIQTANREFVLVARSIGARHIRILLAEIVPNVVRPVLTMAITVIGFTMVTEGALSFLGLGVPMPRPTWGGMINEGRQQLLTSPWLVAAPAVALLLTVLALNVVSERLTKRLGFGEVRS
jgi:peptide/nickel transport system permease protein